LAFVLSFLFSHNFSTFIAERCVGVSKEPRRGQRKNYKDIEQKNRQLISDIQSTKYQQAVLEKVFTQFHIDAIKKKKQIMQ
jgi:hypothetical protein